MAATKTDEAADVALEAIKRLEAMEGELRVRLDTLTRIKAALEKAWEFRSRLSAQPSPQRPYGDRLWPSA